MPIKAENRARYPKNWSQIRERILQRAGHRCEWVHNGKRCTAAHHAVGVWEMRDGLWRWVPDHGSGPCDAAGQGLSWPDLQRMTWAEARQFAADLDWDEIDGDKPKPIVIVLTVAHLDHDPANCADDNLRAWCQRHHLAYDHQHHQANAQATRRAKSGTLELFE